MNRENNIIAQEKIIISGIMDPGGGGVDMKMKVDTQEEYKKKGKKGDFNTQGNNNIYHQIFLHFIT